MSLYDYKNDDLAFMQKNPTKINQKSVQTCLENHCLQWHHLNLIIFFHFPSSLLNNLHLKKIPVF